MAREPRSARYASKLGKPLPVFCCHSFVGDVRREQY
jgi:hypothetical protein